MAKRRKIKDNPKIEEIVKKESSEKKGVHPTMTNLTIQVIILSSAFLLTGLGVKYFGPDKKTEPQYKTVEEKVDETPIDSIEEKVDDSWDFLKRSIELPENLDEKVTREILQRDFAFVGIKRSLPKESYEYKEIMKHWDNIHKIASEMILELGYDKKGNYEVTNYQMIYLVPESAKVSKQVLEYSKRAVEFMYKKIPSMKKIDLKWVEAKAGRSYDKDWNKHVFIAKRSVSLFVTEVVNENNPEQFVTMLDGEYRNGAKCPMFTTEPYKGMWYIIIPSNPYSLVAPFSEVGPATLVDEHLDYVKKVGKEQALEFLEGVSESWSWELALEHVENEKIPDGKKLVDEIYHHALKTNDIYKLVLPAKKWVEEVGLDRSYQLVKESFEKSHEAIRNIK